jgi:hypothetical protein
MGFFTRIGIAHRKAKMKSGSSTKGLKRKKKISIPKPNFSKTKIISGKRYNLDRKFKKNEETRRNKNE